MIPFFITVWSVVGIFATMCISFEEVDLEKISRKQRIFLIFILGPLIWFTCLCKLIWFYIIVKFWKFLEDKPKEEINDDPDFNPLEEFLTSHEKDAE